MLNAKQNTFFAQFNPEFDTVNDEAGAAFIYSQRFLSDFLDDG